MGALVNTESAARLNGACLLRLNPPPPRSRRKPNGRKAPRSALEGSQNAVQWAMSAPEGKKLGEQKRGSLPVFDCVVAARGRIYYTATDGDVVCLGGEQWGADEVISVACMFRAPRTPSRSRSSLKAGLQTWGVSKSPTERQLRIGPPLVSVVR